MKKLTVVFWLDGRQVKLGTVVKDMCLLAHFFSLQLVRAFKVKGLNNKLMIKFVFCRWKITPTEGKKGAGM